MLSFLFFWLFHQCVLYNLNQQFIPARIVIPSVSVSESRIGYYRCPNDYQLFPDQESLLTHWQIDDPFQYDSYQLSEDSSRQEWLETLKTQK